MSLPQFNIISDFDAIKYVFFIIISGGTMNEKIINLLKSYQPNISGVKRKSSILIPLIMKDGAWHLMYEVRSFDLTSQPGEICFPGGKMESGENPSQTAVRETCEELNLTPEDIEVISQIDSILTSFNMIIHCHVGIINKPFEEIKYASDEVDHLFLVPVSYLCHHKPEEYVINTTFDLPESFPFESIPNGKDYNFKNSSYPVIFYHYNDKTIWGLTARMTKSFIELVNSACQHF